MQNFVHECRFSRPEKPKVLTIQWQKCSSPLVQPELLRYTRSLSQEDHLPQLAKSFCSFERNVIFITYITTPPGTLLNFQRESLRKNTVVTTSLQKTLQKNKPLTYCCTVAHVLLYSDIYVLYITLHEAEQKIRYMRTSNLFQSTKFKERIVRNKSILLFVTTQLNINQSCSTVASYQKLFFSKIYDCTGNGRWIQRDILCNYCYFS